MDTDNDGCETGELRLTGGTSSSSSGVVEVCVNGVWGTICDYKNEWSDNNTAVACNQLNLDFSSNLIHTQTANSSVYVNTCVWYYRCFILCDWIFFEWSSPV